MACKNIRLKFRPTDFHVVSGVRSRRGSRAGAAKFSAEDAQHASEDYCGQGSQGLSLIESARACGALCDDDHA